MIYKFKLFLILGFLILSHGQGITQEVVGEIEFIGNEHISDGQLETWSGMRENSPFSPVMIKSANKKIITGYQEAGYLFARIDSTIFSDKARANFMSIRWYVNEGSLVRLGKVRMIPDSLNIEDLENLVDFNEGDNYRKDIIESEITRIGQYYAEKGYPLATIDIINTSLRSDNDIKYIDLDIKINAGQAISINKIILRGNQATHDEVILRELSIKDGQRYNQKKIDDIPKQLNHLGYFSEVSPVKAIGLRDGKTDLLVEVKEGNTTSFDGIVGYIPPPQASPTEEGYFTGLINLNFRNLFGTGRKFEVNWRKPDKYSEEFRLYYEEPWVFNFPMNLGAGLERIVRDTTYIERSYFLNSTLKLSAEFKAFLNIRHNEVIPDSLASRVLRMTRNTTTSGEIGIQYDTRDFPVNPRKGLRYMASFSFGTKENTGPEYLITEDSLAVREGIKTIRGQLSFFQNLWQNQVLAIKFNGSHIEGDNNQLQLSDHFWFGGFGSLRGYRENQFHGTSVSWVNLEYRFIIGRNSRVFLFNDWGFYQYEDALGIQNDILAGYGVGIRFDTPLGVMGIDYGLGKGDTFSTGKIHFGIINTF
jgi:outer membrane protein insertion porin family